MYICPICQREFTTDTAVAKHSLKCWREKNPNHQSKPAPHSETIENKQIDDNILQFFTMLQKGAK